jgi:hypothetical protein
MTDRTGKEILDGLCALDRKLVFIDESETAGKQVPQLAADYIVMCGVCMASEKYGAVKNNMKLALSDWAVDEFHATEIVHPRRGSRWKSIRPSRRQAALAFLSNTLETCAESIFYCNISGEQYYGELQPKILAEWGPVLDHKESLYKVFFGSLIPRLRINSVPSAVVIDSTLDLGNAHIGLQEIVDSGGFYEKSIIHVDSRVEAGIQLADFAAYILNRIHRVAHKQSLGQTNAFDEIVKESFRRIEPLLVNLLDAKFH